MCGRPLGRIRDRVQVSILGHDRSELSGAARALAPIGWFGCVLFAPVPLADRGQYALVYLIGFRGGHLCLGHGPKGGCTTAAFERGPLAEDGTWPHLGQPFAVDLDREDPVEQEEDLVALRSLFREEVTLVDVADGGLGAAPHDVAREFALERGLHGGDERGRVLVTAVGCASRTSDATSP